MRYDIMRQKWKKTQVVEITIDEIFCLQDKLDMVRDKPEEVWNVIDDFLAICESQLELSPTFLKQLHEVNIDDDFIPLSEEDINELFEDDDGEQCYNVAEAYVNYILNKKTKIDEKEKYDIPFQPTLNF